MAIDDTMSAELRDELARNDVRRLVDPRGVPVRFSHLKAMDRSPAHYVHAVQHEREESLSMRLGSATHALVFGTPRVVVFRGGMFNGKQYNVQMPLDPGPTVRLQVTPMISSNQSAPPSVPYPAQNAIPPVGSAPQGF
jgi:hypothetical protein